MLNNVTICVGTLGQGVWRSTDGGDNWERVREGIYSEGSVRSLVVHPKDDNVMYAGVDDGIYRSDNRGESWERLDSPMNEIPIWTLAIDPVDPKIIFAGTRPAALYRSTDEGRTWKKLAVEIADECPNVRIPRVTALLVDPYNHNNVWAGVEVDGVRRSRDGGETWEAVNGALNDPDIHNLAITSGPPKTLLTITPREVFASTDDGESWSGVGAAKQVSIPYCRAVAVKPDDAQVVYMGNGNGAFGDAGAVHRSRDRGATWESLSLPVRPNGSVWDLATHPSDPQYVLASTVNGQLFYSSSGGDTWNKIDRDFGEIHSLAWVANS